MPDGFENLHTQKEIADALHQLKLKNPCLRKAVIKINEGFGSNDVLKYFIDRQINIEAFNEILPSLNEIFIKQVEGTKATTRSFQKIEA